MQVLHSQEMPLKQRTSIIIVFALIAMGFCEGQRPARDFHRRTGMLLDSHREFLDHARDHAHIWCPMPMFVKTCLDIVMFQVLYIPHMEVFTEFWSCDYILYHFEILDAIPTCLFIHIYTYMFRCVYNVSSSYIPLAWAVWPGRSLMDNEVGIGVSKVKEMRVFKCELWVF